MGKPELVVVTTPHGGTPILLVKLGLALITTFLLFAPFVQFTSPPVSNSPWEGLATHCKDAQPIHATEFLERQRQLAHALHALNGSAYIAEPGASALFFGNITDRARLLIVPGVDVAYVEWQEDDDPYAIALEALRITSKGLVYVDGMTRHFIVDGFEKAAPGLRVLAAPLEITSLRERKSPSEIALLRCVNEVHVAWWKVLRIRIGMRESEVMRMIDEALAAAGLTDRWALVLFGENAALPHGAGTDRVLGTPDLILIDTGGVLFGYHSDVTRTFRLEDSRIPEDHSRIWWDVHAAQTAALGTANAGIIAAEVDKAARTELNERGLGPYFTHRLGHGIGLEDHETPYLRGGSDAVIRTGHAFSNEPGVYITGKVRIRLEDCFYINDEGGAVYLTAGVGGQAKDPLHP